MTAPSAGGGPVDDAATGWQVAARLGLQPLPAEGGMFRRTHTLPGCTVIYYLVAGQDFSALHRLRSADELYLFHAGAPLRLLTLDADGGREHLLGSPVAGGSPQLLVPAGTWQGSASAGGWSLVSTVVVPGFEWSDFELGNRDGLCAEHPGWAERIIRLTR